MGDPPGLSDEQRRALDRLSLLPVLGAYYLAGGTGLAIQLSHRRSVFPPGLDAKRWEEVKAFFVKEAPKLVSPSGMQPAI